MTASRRLAPLPLRLTALLALLALGGALLWSAPVQAQALTVLVKNTGQSAASSGGSLNATDPLYAQPFTTGANANGYALSSIGIRFRTIGDTSTAGSELTARLYKGIPFAATSLCTLTDPETFAASGLHTFDAPTTNHCPKLEPNTTYFAAIGRANNDSGAIAIDITAANAEDSGGAAGWTVGNQLFSLVPPISWLGNPSTKAMIEIKGAAIPPRVTDFDLHSSNSAPRGVWGNDETIWVANDGSGNADKLYAYNRSDGSRDTSADFDTLRAAGNQDPRGICSDGTTMFVADNGDNKIYAYKMSDTTRDSGKDVTLDSANNSPQGLSCDSSHLWVAEDNNDLTSKIFVYLRSDGSHVSTLDIGAGTLSPSTTVGAINNNDQRGMWSNGTTLFVVDHGDSQVYGYQLSDRTRDNDKNLSLDAANTNPWGLWFDGRVLWVADTADDKLYVYDLPGAQPGNTRATGDPTVTGTLFQGETLTADTSGITDATDGLANVYYHHQWIRVDGTTVTELAGETASTYTTTADDVDKDIQVRVVFDDDAGNKEYPRYSPQVTVLAVPPKVTSVALTSDPNDDGRTGNDDTYAIDDDVTATVTFDKAADITGSPQITLLFGTAEKTADCAAATNTTTMECSYDVVAHDTAPSGVGIKANSLVLNSGTIYATGSTTNAATLTHSALALQSGHKVDGVRPTLVTTGNDAPITNADGAQIILSFSEDVSGADRNDFTVESNSVAQTIDSTGGTGKLILLVLATALTASDTNLTVSLAVGAVTDIVGNSILAQSAVTILNQVSAAPTAPTGLIAEPAPDETPQLAVDLSWTAPSSDGGSAITSHEYRYYRNSGSFGSWTTIDNSAANGANATSFTVKGLSAVDNSITTFAFEVRAVNANGNGSESNQDTATIGWPNPVDDFTTVPGDGEIEMTWTTPDNQGSAILRYEYQVINRDTNTYIVNPGTNIPGSNAETETFTVTGLTNGVPYAVAVRAVNSVEAGPYTQEDEIVPATFPTAPRNLTAESGDTQVTLRWNAPQSNGGDAIEEYQYQQKTGNGAFGSWTPITGSNANTTEHTVTGLTNGTSYSFKVRAKNTPGEGPGSNEVTAVPRTVPTTPQNFAATAGNGRVQLDWTTPSSDGGLPINRYQYRYKAGTGSFTTWANVPGSNVNTTTYTVTGLTNGTIHTFEVRAATASTFGVAASVTETPMADPPDKPSVRVQGRDTALYVSWTVADDGGSSITEYQVQWKSGAQDFDSSRQQAGLTGANTLIENLINGTEYDVQVRVMNSAGWSPWSDSVSGTPVEGPAVSLSTTTLTMDEGDSDAYYVGIATEPTSTVTIRISAEGDVTTEPNTLRFTASNWDTGQRVTINAGQDGDATDDTVTITHTVASGSAAEYASLTGLPAIQVTVLDDDVPPPPVRGFIAADESQDAIALSWWSERGAAEYQLEYRKQGDTGNWTRITRGDFDHLPSTSGNRSLTAIATGLDCNTTYDFRIRMRGSGDILLNAFGPHTEVSHKTGRCAQPDRPTNLMYTLAPDCATLTWTAPTGGDYTGVRIRRLTLGDANHTVIHEELNSRPTSYRDCTHTGDGYGDGDGPEYSYMVSYIKSGPRGIAESKPAYSGLHQYGPAFQDHLHATPRNVRLTLDTDSRRRMTWEAPPSWSLTIWAGLQGGSVPVRDPWITGYVVERREFRTRADGYLYFPEVEDEHIWSATMTVGASTTGTPATGYFGLGSSPYGALTQTTFTHPVGSGSWTVTSLDISAATGLRLTILEALPLTEDLLYGAFEDWVLVVDGRSFPFELPEGGIGGGVLQVAWPNPGLSWTNGQQVSVQLVERELFEWERLRRGRDGDTSTSFTDNEQANGRKFVYRILTTNTLGTSSRHAIFDWLWDSPYRDAVVDLAATDITTDDGGAGDGETNTGNTGDGSANNAATGAPAISGTPQVGETLTASTSGIADADGLTSVSYRYQWIAGGSDIAGATGSSYTLTASEQGQTIQVRVTFTDDLDNAETLTSAATVEVAAAPAPLTASLPDSRFQSARHNGAGDRPQVIVAFSLPVASFEMTTPSVSLTGATVSSVRRHQEDGLDNAWIFFLDPDRNEDMVFSLATDQPCDSGGICTEDGGMLSEGVQVTLSGPEEKEQEEAGDDQQEPQSPPPAPTSLTATVNADGHIVLSWTAPNDDSITGYQVLRRRPGEGESALLVYVADTRSTATTFTDTGVTAGVKHVYRVKAINAAGLSDWSNYVNPTP